MDNPPRRTTGVYLQTSTTPFFLIPAGDSTHIPARGMPQTQQPSTHAAPPPTRSPRQCSSAVDSDQRSRPPSHPWKILRGSFRSRSTYSRRLSTATNAPSPAVSAVTNAARKFSDNDSQDSSSATPNNSTQLSDVRCTYVLSTLPKRTTPLIEPSLGQYSPVLACHRI